MDRGPPAAPEDRRTQGRALVETAPVPRRADGAAVLPAVRALLAEAERGRTRFEWKERPAPPDGAAVPPDGLRERAALPSKCAEEAMV